MRHSYTERFKLRVVQALVRGEDSIKGLARKHGLDPSMVRKWVARYQHHGLNGLCEKPNHIYSAEFKIEVLETIRRDGLSMRQAEAIFDIRRQGVISSWIQTYSCDGATTFPPNGKGQSVMVKTPSIPTGQNKADERSREELLEELASLRAENAYLKKLDALIQEQTSARRKKRTSSKG